MTRKRFTYTDSAGVERSFRAADLALAKANVVRVETDRSDSVAAGHVAARTVREAVEADDFTQVAGAVDEASGTVYSDAEGGL